MMENYLVITALGKDSPGLIEQLTRTIRDCGCNITESRMTNLGCELCIIMLLAGTWDSIAKMEDMAGRLEKRLGMSITVKRTEPNKFGNNLMPYAIDVVSLDHVGIVHDIAKFMAENNISIQDMHTNAYKAGNTGTPMFSLHMTVNIPANISIAAIRGDFMEFCDQLNLDAIMEPVK
jgi:glycine cleavage system transcriptional repressor